MATLLCQTNPELAIYDPADGSWTKFSGGRLDIDKDDPHYDVVMAEATRNPGIAVYQSVHTCIHCGEDFKSNANLQSHVKQIHFDKWLGEEDRSYGETRVAEIKAREGVVCDACTPAQTFPDEKALAAHIKVMHTAAPTDEEG